MRSRLSTHPALAVVIGWQDVAPGTRSRLLRVFCAGIRMRSLLSNTLTLLVVAGTIIAENPRPAYVVWLAVVTAGGFLTRFYAAHLLRLDRFDSGPEIKALGFLALSSVYGMIWGIGPFLMLPNVSGTSAGVLLMMVVFGTVMGPYAAMPGILYVRLAVTGLMTLTAIALYMDAQVTIVSIVLAGWLVLRTDVWRGYHRALREQLDLGQALEQRQRKLEQVNEEKEQANRKLRIMAETDPLTGAGNRRQLVAGLHAVHGPAALIIFDIDNFKIVNDRMGHQCGDTLLVTLVALIRETLREGDLLARLGGDEFAILLPRTPHDVAWALAERIRESVVRHVVYVGDTPVRATVSLGMALVAGDTISASASDLLREADAALYVAKRQGRNRVRGAESADAATVAG